MTNSTNRPSLARVHTICCVNFFLKLFFFCIGYATLSHSLVPFTLFNNTRPTHNNNMKTIKRKISRVFNSGGGGGSGNVGGAEHEDKMPSSTAATFAAQNGDNCVHQQQKQKLEQNGHNNNGSNYYPQAAAMVDDPSLKNRHQQQQWNCPSNNNNNGCCINSTQQQQQLRFGPANDGNGAVNGGGGGANCRTNNNAFLIIPSSAAAAASSSAQATKSKYRWSLSDSLSLLGERIAEMTVHEEAPTTTTTAAVIAPSNNDQCSRLYNNKNCTVPSNEQSRTIRCSMRPSSTSSTSNTSNSYYYENGVGGAGHNNNNNNNTTGAIPGVAAAAVADEHPVMVVLMRPNKKKGRQQQQQKTKSWHHASRWFGNFGGHLAMSTTTTTKPPSMMSLPPTPIACHNNTNNNNKQLGSDGESVEVSPMSTSSDDQQQHQHSTTTSACSSNQGSVAAAAAAAAAATAYDEYVPNVKMRNKRNKQLERRRWSEEEIQKRLSLPAYISIPPSVIEKMNRTAAMAAASATSNNSSSGGDDSMMLMSRKSRRASLTEIGFGRMETYKKILDLGSGTYAKVFLGQSMLTGRSVALKEIRLEHEEGAPCTAIREVSLLRNLRHANIVTLHDVVHTDSILTLVFEFVEQDLREYMEQLDGLISIGNVKLFLMQLLRGLAYCHARRILHRDLKPQNLLITAGGELKLADFGLARAQSIPIKTYSAEVVTLWYRPPDLLLGSTDYTTHIDMWAVGCILYEMLNHRPMFPGATPPEQLALVFQKLGTPRPDTHPQMCALPGWRRMKCRAWPTHSPKSLLNPPRVNRERVDLLMKLLKYDGRQRISAECAMRHPFLSCFPQALFKLADTASIFTLPNINFVPDKKVGTPPPFMMGNGGGGGGFVAAMDHPHLDELFLPSELMSMTKRNKRR